MKNIIILLLCLFSIQASSQEFGTRVHLKNPFGGANNAQSFADSVKSEVDNIDSLHTIKRYIDLYRTTSFQDTVTTSIDTMLFSSSANYTSLWFSHSNGVITYENTQVKQFHATVTISASSVDADKEYEFYIYENEVERAKMKKYFATANKGDCIVLQTTVTLSENDTVYLQRLVDAGTGELTIEEVKIILTEIK